MLKEVKKRNGQRVRFNPLNIRSAILSANEEVSPIERVTDEEIDGIINKISNFKKDFVHIEVIQDYIQKSLMKLGHYELAEKYITYRYIHGVNRDLTETEQSILKLIRGENTDVIEENSNKNAYVNSTQRDLIAGEVSKEISKKFLLPEDIKKANEDQIFHWHDLDYTVQPMFNCCLVDVKNVLDNGTVMNNYLIESPRSFRVACTVITQVIAAVASNQYGGQSVDLRHLGKYVAISREKIAIREREDLENAGIKVTEKQLEKIVENKLLREVSDGVQTIQYQLNTLYTSNGQSPFVTLFLYIEDGHEYEEEIAMIVREVIKQRYEGIKGKDGRYITPSFPKLIYVLDENNYKKGTKYWGLTQECARCSIKRSYPDYISAKKMRENYEGNVFSPMGCVDGSELVTVSYDNKVRVMSFESFYAEMKSRFDEYDQKTNNKADDLTEYFYIDLKDVKIYDNKLNKFVDCYRVIRNKWSEPCKHITLYEESGSRVTLRMTFDHPLEIIGKGVVKAEDLVIGDKVLKNKTYSSASVVCMKALTGAYLSFASEEDFIENQLGNAEYEISDIKELDKHSEFSYDVTTESEHFEVSGIYSHNCRSFLAPWKKTKEYVEYMGEPESEIGKYKFEGRFNQGVISINLPQIAIEANHDMDKFWQLFNERMALCYKALLLRHKLLEGITSDVSPVHWQFGVLARLKSGEKIDFLLHNGYSTLSLGYIGFYEMTQAMLGKSNTTPEGKEFALKVMNAMRDQVRNWKAQTGLGFALYGTPAESLCYTFAKHDFEKYGSIPNVTDHGYYTNSYHIDVREHVNAFEKFKFEAEFQDLTTGGSISYVEIPNLEKNKPAIEKLITYIYDTIQYAEFNSKSDLCYKCGFEGEIILNNENHWECPQCHNKDMKEMMIVRRTCGYLGLNDWNEGKRKEIGQRVLHL